MTMDPQKPAMRKISWGRGLFRLWAVLSIIEVGFVWTLLIADNLDPYFPGFSVMSNASGDYFYSNFSDDSRSLEAMNEAKAFSKTETSPSLNSSIFTVTGIPSDEQRLYLTRAEKALNEKKAAYVSQRRWDAALSSLWAFVPPAVILVIGYLFYWAFSGFKAKEN